MPCYKPLEAWRTSESTSNGKKKIAFKKSATSLYPIQLPCNMCIGCRLDRSLSWAIRCVHESQLHTQNSFITLTYAPEHLPQYGSLQHGHFQTFIRKLRRSLPHKTIRYFMCGEYGEDLSHPHYHACLFGHDFHDKQIWKEQEGILTYVSESLETLWGHGFTTTGELNFDTAAYTARYITKKITGPQAENHYQSTDQHTGDLINLTPEYANMSLKPGIAGDYYNKFKSDLYPSDYIIHGGKKITLPRYYDNIYEANNGDLDEIKRLRKLNAKKHQANNTPERLDVRHKIKLINHNKLLRKLENET
nr:MAG: replication initiation protein [Microvirus sp.]